MPTREQWAAAKAAVGDSEAARLVLGGWVLSRLARDVEDQGDGTKEASQ